MSDDYSPDDTYSDMKYEVSVYSGDKNVILNWNPKNFGLIQNFNQALWRVTGDIVVLAAGDVISMPSRIESTVEVLTSKEKCVEVIFGAQVIDEYGVSLNSGNTNTDGLSSYIL